jgi:hypothetical protein
LAEELKWIVGGIIIFPLINAVILVGVVLKNIKE